MMESINGFKEGLTCSSSWETYIKEKFERRFSDDFFSLPLKTQLLAALLARFYDGYRTIYSEI